jgi:hypothetical protein
MTPIRYTAEILPDGHLPLPQGFPGRAGERVNVTLASTEEESADALGRRQWANAIQDLAGAVSSGLTDVSVNHDDYLYGKPGAK